MILVVLAMVVVVALASTSVALAGPPVHQLSGGGTVDVPDLGTRSVYAFEASIDASGSVKGQGQVYLSRADTRVHLDITCLVVDGNKAWLGGTVTSTKSDIYPAGTGFVWRVTDNGEGAALPDQVSTFGRVDPDFCSEEPTFPLKDWTNGNVQIR
jgi:hypothetical protein